MTRFADRVWLVTGGRAGIGRAVAERALADGAAGVVITGRDADGGKETAAELGEHVTFLEQDVTDEARWDEVVDEVLARFGRLDVLVNNAGWVGSGNPQSPETTPFEEWHSILAVNLDGTFLGCRAGIRAMKDEGGAIVNMSSTAGLLGVPAFIAYGAAKAAVAHLTKSVAVYCARQGFRIRCNVVHPALVETTMSDTIIGLYGGEYETARANYLARVPLGELGKPEDVADAVAFLASDESAYVTGAQLVVGGGLGV
jgi:NAD(P)-dependent dehydrogenase (short-subunit alcohol dehydrogenase family)